MKTYAIGRRQSLSAILLVAAFVLASFCCMADAGTARGDISATVLTEPDENNNGTASVTITGTSITEAVVPETVSIDGNTYDVVTLSGAEEGLKGVLTKLDITKASKLTTIASFKDFTALKEVWFGDCKAATDGDSFAAGAKVYITMGEGESDDPGYVYSFHPAYKVTVDAGEGGTVSDPVLWSAGNENVSVGYVPNTGSALQSVSVDGTTIGLPAANPFDVSVTDKNVAVVLTFGSENNGKTPISTGGENPTTTPGDLNPGGGKTPADTSTENPITTPGDSTPGGNGKTPTGTGTENPITTPGDSTPGGKIPNSLNPGDKTPAGTNPMDPITPPYNPPINPPITPPYNPPSVSVNNTNPGGFQPILVTEPDSGTPYYEEEMYSAPRNDHNPPVDPLMLGGGIGLIGLLTFFIFFILMRRLDEDDDDPDLHSMTA